MMNSRYNSLIEKLSEIQNGTEFYENDEHDVTNFWINLITNSNLNPYFYDFISHNITKDECNAKNEKGISPFIHAINLNLNNNLISILIQNGADYNQLCSDSIPVIYHSKSFRVFQFLYGNGAEIKLRKDHNVKIHSLILESSDLNLKDKINIYQLIIVNRTLI